MTDQADLAGREIIDLIISVLMEESERIISAQNALVLSGFRAQASREQLGRACILNAAAAVFVCLGAEGSELENLRLAGPGRHERPGHPATARRAFIGGLIRTARAELKRTGRASQQ